MEKVGEFCVDAGICWIGDPCYVMPYDASGADVVRNWDKFCDQLKTADGQPKDAAQFRFKEGHIGLGVCVSTGWGDGQYPVYIERNEEGRIARVLIEFIPEEEDEYDEPSEYDEWQSYDPDC